MLYPESCCACGEFELKEYLDITSWIDDNDQIQYVPAIYSICRYCGTEQANTRQAKLNKEAIMKYGGKNDE